MTDPQSSEYDLSEWDACDEHATTFRKGSTCPKCLEDMMREAAEAAERAQGWEPWMDA